MSERLPDRLIPACPRFASYDLFFNSRVAALHNSNNGISISNNVNSSSEPHIFAVSPWDSSAAGVNRDQRSNPELVVNNIVDDTVPESGAEIVRQREELKKEVGINDREDMLGIASGSRHRLRSVQSSPQSRSGPFVTSSLPSASRSPRMSDNPNRRNIQAVDGVFPATYSRSPDSMGGSLDIPERHFVSRVPLLSREPSPGEMDGPAARALNMSTESSLNLGTALDHSSQVGITFPLGGTSPESESVVETVFPAPLSRQETLSARSVCRRREEAGRASSQHTPSGFATPRGVRASSSKEEARRTCAAYKSEVQPNCWSWYDENDTLRNISPERQKRRDDYGSDCATPGVALTQDAANAATVQRKAQNCSTTAEDEENDVLEWQESSSLSENSSSSHANSDEKSSSNMRTPKLTARPSSKEPGTAHLISSSPLPLYSSQRLGGSKQLSRSDNGTFPPPSSFQIPLGATLAPPSCRYTTPTVKSPESGSTVPHFYEQFVDFPSPLPLSSFNRPTLCSPRPTRDGVFDHEGGGGKIGSNGGQQCQGSPRTPKHSPTKIGTFAGTTSFGVSDWSFCQNSKQNSSKQTSPGVNPPSKRFLEMDNMSTNIISPAAELKQRRSFNASSVPPPVSCSMQQPQREMESFLFNSTARSSKGRRVRVSLFQNKKTKEKSVVINGIVVSEEHLKGFDQSNNIDGNNSGNCTSSSGVPNTRSGGISVTDQSAGRHDSIPELCEQLFIRCNTEGEILVPLYFDIPVRFTQPPTLVGCSTAWSPAFTPSSDTSPSAAALAQSTGTPSTIDCLSPILPLPPTESRFVSSPAAESGFMLPSARDATRVPAAQRPLGSVAVMQQDHLSIFIAGNPSRRFSILGLPSTIMEDRQLAIGAQITCVATSQVPCSCSHCRHCTFFAVARRSGIIHVSVCLGRDSYLSNVVFIIQNGQVPVTSMHICSHMLVCGTADGQLSLYNLVFILDTPELKGRNGSPCSFQSQSSQEMIASLTHRPVGSAEQRFINPTRVHRVLSDDVYGEMEEMPNYQDIPNLCMISRFPVRAGLETVHLSREPNTTANDSNSENENNTGMTEERDDVQIWGGNSTLENTLHSDSDLTNKNNSICSKSLGIWKVEISPDLRLIAVATSQAVMVYRTGSNSSFSNLSDNCVEKGRVQAPLDLISVLRGQNSSLSASVMCWCGRQTRFLTSVGWGTAASLPPPVPTVKQPTIAFASGSKGTMIFVKQLVDVTYQLEPGAVSDSSENNVTLASVETSCEILDMVCSHYGYELVVSLGRALQGSGSRDSISRSTNGSRNQNSIIVYSWRRDVFEARTMVSLMEPPLPLPLIVGTTSASPFRTTFNEQGGLRMLGTPEIVNRKASRSPVGVPISPQHACGVESVASRVGLGGKGRASRLSSPLHNNFRFMQVSASNSRINSPLAPTKLRTGSSPFRIENSAIMSQNEWNFGMTALQQQQDGTIPRDPSLMGSEFFSGAPLASHMQVESNSPSSTVVRDQTRRLITLQPVASCRTLTQLPAACLSLSPCGRFLLSYYHSGFNAHKGIWGLDALDALRIDGVSNRVLGSLRVWSLFPSDNDTLINNNYFLKDVPRLLRERASSLG